MFSRYINGFHDAANAIATVVSTRVLTPRVAVLLAASFNLVGALWGEAVAKTVGAGLVDTNYVTTVTILAAMLTGICWNLLTWWLGLDKLKSRTDRRVMRRGAGLGERALGRN